MNGSVQPSASTSTPSTPTLPNYLAPQQTYGAAQAPDVDAQKSNVGSAFGFNFSNVGQAPYQPGYSTVPRVPIGSPPSAFNTAFGGFNPSPYSYNPNVFGNFYGMSSYNPYFGGMSPYNWVNPTYGIRQAMYTRTPTQAQMQQAFAPAPAPQVSLEQQLRDLGLLQSKPYDFDGGGG